MNCSFCWWDWWKSCEYLYSRHTRYYRRGHKKKLAIATSAHFSTIFIVKKDSLSEYTRIDSTEDQISRVYKRRDTPAVTVAAAQARRKCFTHGQMRGGRRRRRRRRPQRGSRRRVSAVAIYYISGAVCAHDGDVGENERGFCSAKSAAARFHFVCVFRDCKFAWVCECEWRVFFLQSLDFRWPAGLEF